MAGKTWLITGTSSGFGRYWAKAALERCDRVAATTRDTAALDELVAAYGDRVLPIALDITDKPAVDAAVTQVVDHFGRIDVVVNNAGYGLFGAIEEISEQQARAQIETNVFGTLWVTKAVLPTLRAQGSGHIIQVSSIGGVNAFPTMGIYHASKWAIEGFTQSLAAELAPLGIAVTLVEPFMFPTNFGSSSAVRAEPNPAYDPARAALGARFTGSVPGDAASTSAAILALVDAERPPLRLILGDGALEIMKREYDQRVATWEQGQALATSGQHSFSHE
jgi:NAD(P)-dependent dehydrogenase (short-subunit alcohol dehydrogenase family)